MDGPDEVLIEFHQLGHAVKVTAVDPATLTEVSIIGPVNAPQTQLERTAIAKLRYVLSGRRDSRPTRQGDRIAPTGRGTVA
jgi:hypothetical protein